MKSSYSISNLSNISDCSLSPSKYRHTSHFIQVLDESLCVVREDLNEWLHDYLFSSENLDFIAPVYLLNRLSSGLWLSRLAYKLHHSVFAKSKCSASTKTQLGNKTAAFGFLQGPVSSPELKQFSAHNLPPFPQTLTACARLPLGPSDVCTFADESQSNSRSDSTNSLCWDQKNLTENINGNVHLMSSVSNIADRWIARDNVSSFIKWCRDLGIRETILFETSGLVNKTEEKNVLLTLMELARIAGAFGLAELPYLVKMEREIDYLEAMYQGREQLGFDVYSNSNCNVYGDRNGTDSTRANNAKHESTQDVAFNAKPLNGVSTRPNDNLPTATTAANQIDRLKKTNGVNSMASQSCHRTSSNWDLDLNTTISASTDSVNYDSSSSIINSHYHHDRRDSKCLSNGLHSTIIVPNDSSSSIKGNSKVIRVASTLTTTVNGSTIPTNRLTTANGDLHANTNLSSDSAQAVDAGHGNSNSCEVRIKIQNQPNWNDFATDLIRPNEACPSSVTTRSSFDLTHQRATANNNSNASVGVCHNASLDDTFDISFQHDESKSSMAMDESTLGGSNNSNYYMDDVNRAGMDYKHIGTLNSRGHIVGSSAKALETEDDFYSTHNLSQIKLEKLSGLANLDNTSSVKNRQSTVKHDNDDDAVDELVVGVKNSSNIEPTSVERICDPYVQCEDQHLPFDSSSSHTDTLKDNEIQNSPSCVNSIYVTIRKRCLSGNCLIKNRTETSALSIDADDCTPVKMMRLATETHSDVPYDDGGMSSNNKQTSCVNTDVNCDLTNEFRGEDLDSKHMSFLLVDRQVNKKLAQCTCCHRLKMQRLEEGRYRLGSRIYYLRRFRNHVMVRVGGGWLTLDQFLQRHDPCRQRTSSKQHSHCDQVRLERVADPNCRPRRSPRFSYSTTAPLPSKSEFIASTLVHNRCTDATNCDMSSSHSCSDSTNNSANHCSELSVDCGLVKNSQTDRASNSSDSGCKNDTTNSTHTNGDQRRLSHKSMIPRLVTHNFDQHGMTKNFSSTLSIHTMDGGVGNERLKTTSRYMNKSSFKSNIGSARYSSQRSSLSNSVSCSSKLSARCNSVSKLTNDKQQQRWKF